MRVSGHVVERRPVVQVVSAVVPVVEAALPALVQLAGGMVQVRQLHHLDLILEIQVVVGCVVREWWRAPVVDAMVRRRRRRVLSWQWRQVLVGGSHHGGREWWGRTHHSWRRVTWISTCLTPSSRWRLVGCRCMVRWRTCRHPPRLSWDLHHPPEPCLLGSAHQQEDG